jgi:hypothetical protein
MTRQRAHHRVRSHPSAPDTERLEETAARLGLSPAEISRELAAADGASRARALDDLQSEAGNAAISGMLGASGTMAGFGIGRGGVTTHTADLTISRDAPPDEVVAVEEPAATVTESVGPVAETGYPVEGSSLEDVATVIEGQPEAGHVAWAPAFEFTQAGGRIDSVTINVAIELQMPSWSPPAEMLPRARAEWDRWYAALQAHEQGHIDLVHAVFDGLAQRILGTTVRTGRRMFARAKSSLATQSRAYDRRTRHGIRQGTVMNVSIEQRELDEERRRQEAAERAERREGAVPDVGDEGA